MKKDINPDFYDLEQYGINTAKVKSFYEEQPVMEYDDGPIVTVDGLMSPDILARCAIVGDAVDFTDTIIDTIDKEYGVSQNKRSVSREQVLLKLVSQLVPDEAYVLTKQWGLNESAVLSDRQIAMFLNISTEEVRVLQTLAKQHVKELLALPQNKKYLSVVYPRENLLTRITNSLGPQNKIQSI